MSLLPAAARSFPPDPRPAFPNGWLGIGFTDDVALGQVVSRHILGRDLVLFRTGAGVLTVADAYCPHLGAHLGGGAVVEDTLRCPFHHWQFGSDGRCTRTPGDRKLPERARLRTWLACEVNGFIFVWHHAQDAAPSWDIPPHPIVEDRDYYLVEKREHLFRAHPQDISENGADFAHFEAIHGWSGVRLKFVPDGTSYRVGYDTSEVDTGYGDTGSVGVDSLAVGPGYTYTHYTGAADWLMLTCYTPVDPGTVYMHQIYYAHRAVPRPQAKALVEAVDCEWRKDIAIWQAKCYREQPALNDGDGPIAQFRRWYGQFYG
ncbi:MAG: Rieske 2Fe-2S domain-containing protein [Nevskia sp.]|nr:Rieske 2Fe-2S domain-containing protein [Nevskia sp.]